MATALEAHDHGHGLDHETIVSRARTGSLLLILSDAAFVTTAYAAIIYLKALNVNGQFHPKEEAVPNILVGLLLTAVIVVSAGCYYWGERRLRDGSISEYRIGVLVALLLALVALVGEVIVLFSLRYPSPIHAYGSMVLIMTAYHIVHLILTAIIGVLVLGRIWRGRIAGHEYIAEVTGYWWYYVAIAAITTWLITSYLT